MVIIGGLDRLSTVIISMLMGLSIFSWGMIFWSLWAAMSVRFGSLDDLGRLFKQSASERLQKFGAVDFAPFINFFVQEVVEIRFRSIYSACSMLSLFASVSTLLGLLGTVWGLINSMSGFGVANSRILADGVHQALYTTLFGLAVAIPAALFSRAIPILIEGSKGRISDLARNCAIEAVILIKKDKVRENEHRAQL